MSATVVTSHIDTVKLYHQGATVYRTLTIKAASGGALPQAIQIPDLPLALDDATVKLRVTNAPPGAQVTVTDLRVGLWAPPHPNTIEPPEQVRLKEMERELRRLETLKQHLEIEGELFKAVEVPARPRGDHEHQPPASPMAARIALERFIDGALTERQEEQRALNSKLRSLKREIAQLTDAISRASSAREVRPDAITKVVVASLRSPQSEVAQVVLALEYFIAGARWAPAYQCDIHAEGGSALLTMRALICQHSGEDWSRARLLLSTASPSRWTELPRLKSIRIGKTQPPAPRRPGFRPPPRGGEALYHDHDRDLNTVQSRVPEPRPWSPPQLASAPLMPDPHAKPPALSAATSPAPQATTGIFGRLNTLLKANVNDLISRAEDPEKILNQFILDMQELLLEAKKQVALSIADEKRLKKSFDDVSALADDWGKKAREATRASLSVQAKEALARKSEHDRLSNTLRDQWNAQRRAADQLREALRTLNNKIEEVKRKKNLLIARQKRAEVQKNIRTSLTGLDDSSAFDTFARMEQKIAKAEVAELSDESLSFQFEELESDLSQGDALSALKMKMGLVSGPTRLPHFARLRLAREGRSRGRLVVIEQRALYLETLEQSGLEVNLDVMALVQQAAQQARASSNRPLPTDTCDVRAEAGSFDYLYTAEDRVDVPSDGAFHSVPVSRREGRCRLNYVVVPRESTDVFRVAFIENPDRAPMLPGPVEVYIGGNYVLTTALRTVAPRERFRLGLGVEQAIKCARNVRFREERSAEAVVATANLHHTIDVDVINNLGRSISCEVRERLPQPAKDAEVVVSERGVSPPWKEWDQREHSDTPLRGGRRWVIELAAGEEAHLTASYIVQIYANNELKGGNRREA